jgi:hypothetical protein
MAMVIVTTEEAGFAFMSAILGCGVGIVNRVFATIPTAAPGSKYILDSQGNVLHCKRIAFLHIVPSMTRRNK